MLASRKRGCWDRLDRSVFEGLCAHERVCTKPCMPAREPSSASKVLLMSARLDVWQPGELYPHNLLGRPGGDPSARGKVMGTTCTGSEVRLKQAGT